MYFYVPMLPCLPTGRYVVKNSFLLPPDPYRTAFLQIT